MSLPGASSGRSHVRGYSTDRVRSDSVEGSPSDSGMGWDGMGKGRKNSSWKPAADDQPAFSERRAKEFTWAKQHLPGEHPGMVVSALIGLAVAGIKQSTQSVMARLEGQGRTMRQMKAKGWA
jgi:hypothetical protein